MLVDDEEDITSTLKLVLEKDGLAVDAFNDPTLALSSFEAGKYDLVITDIRMPRMGGFDLFRALKNIEPDVRICFFTSFEIHESEFKKTFPNTSVAGLIRKPIAGRALIEEIKAMVSDPDESEAVGHVSEGRSDRSSTA
jgi:DNA-binding response OmpR family regulator